jgi:hypothetical protein
MTGITQSAVLVDLNISVWTARKLDKKVSEEVDVMKGATVRAGNYSKNLLAGSVSLDKIVKHAALARTWHTGQTLPWSDAGTRMLPTKNFLDYKTGINQREAEFNALCAAFYTDYPNLVNAAVMRLGGMCDLSEYPDVNSLPNKFKFRVQFSPIAEAGDWRVDVENETRNELIKQHEDNLRDKEADAMQELWTQLHNTLTHTSTMLSDTKDEAGALSRRPFRATMIDNALQQCTMLSKLNVANDPKMEQARQEMERALTGVHVDTLRNSDEARLSVKSKLDDIINKMSW